MATYDLGTARGRVEVDTSDLRRMEQAVNQAGRSLLLIGGAALAGFALAVKSAADFEAEISHMAAVSGATSKELDQVREKAMQLGRDSAFGAKEAAAAMTELAKAGLSVKEIMAGAADATVTLAAAGDFPLEESATVLVNILRTFNLEAGQSVHIADLLAGAANASTVEVSDLATSMKYAGSVAAALGISVDDTATALAELGNAGIRGSTGGTVLRRILLNLSPASAAARKELKALGIITANGSNQFFDSAGKAKSLSDVFQILQDHTKGLSDQQRVAAFNIIFGARAVSGATILAREGAKGFDALNAQIDKTTAADVMKKRLDNLSGALKIFKASIETALISAGSPVQNTLKNFVRSLTHLVNAFARLPAPIQGAITWLTLIFGLLFSGAGIFLLTVGQVLRMIRVMQELGPALKLITGGLRLVTGAVGDFTIALLTNPIVLIIVAVIALGVALFELYKHSKAFHKFIDDLWQTVQRVWDKILGFFKKLPGYIADAFGAIGRNASKIAGDIGDFFSATGKAIGRFFVRVGHDAANWAGNVGKFAASAGGALGRFITKIPGALNTAGGATVSFFAKLPNIVAYWLGRALGEFIRFIVQTVANIGHWGATLINSIVSFMEQLPGLIGRFFTGTLPAFYNWTGNTLSILLGWGGNVLSTIGSWLSQLPGYIARFFTDTLPAFFGWVGSTIATIASWGANLLITVGAWMSQLPGIVGRFLAMVASAIWGFVSGAGVAAWHWAVDAFNNIVDWIGKIPGAIAGFFVRLWHDLDGFASTAFDKMKSIGKSFWNGFWDGISGSPHTKIEYAVWDMLKNVKSGVDELAGHVATINGMTGGFSARLGTSGTAPLPTPASSGTTIGKIEINNPTGEPAESSIATTMQKLQYLGVLS